MQAENRHRKQYDSETGLWPIFDQAEVFPGHRYRYSPQADKRNKAYLLRLTEAESIFNEYELTCTTP